MAAVRENTSNLFKGSLQVVASLPDIWGEGAIFAFSGIDGDTCTVSGFVASFDLHPYNFLIHTPRRIRLRLPLPSDSKVVAATNDLLAIITDDGEFLVTFSAWHTMVGIFPKSGQPTIEPVDPSEISDPDGMLLADPKSGAVVFLEQDGNRFSLSYGTTPKEAQSRAVEGLHADIPAMVDHRLRWISNIPECATPDETRFLRKCASVMKVNTLSPEGNLPHMWSTPDRIPHHHMWLWDSVFHTVGMNWLDPDLAWEFILSMLEQAYPDGLMPITVLITGPAFRITQPPILAWGVWKNYLVTQNRDRLKVAAPMLEAYLKWNLENRDRNGNGLLEWLIEENELCRSGESGMDNSPRFDTALTLDSVDFSVFQAVDMSCLAKIYTEIGEEEKAIHWKALSNKTSTAIHRLLWNSELSFYTDRDMAGVLSNVRASSGFLPLLLDDTPTERVDLLITALKDQRAFAAPFPIPSVSLDHPQWSTDMWRGGTWVNTNYQVIQGLRAQGRTAEADNLSDTTLAFVRKYYEQFGVIFEFFDASDQRTPPECDRKGIRKLPYDIRRKYDSIRDYHFTASLCLSLMFELDRLRQ